MPWCPNCRYEYRPGFTHCPTCGADLVEEEPPHAPTVAGIRVEENTAHLVEELEEASSHLFAPAYTLAREAFQTVIHARKLLLVILAFTTIHFLGTLIPVWSYLRDQPAFDLYAQPPSIPLMQQWAIGVQQQRPLDYFLQNYTEPLQHSELVAVPFTEAATRISRERFTPVFSGAMTFWAFLLNTLVKCAVQCILISWLIALASNRPRISWKEALYKHFEPLFVVVFFMSLFQALSKTLLYTFEHDINSAVGTRAFDILVSWLLPLGWVLIVLAPFVIVQQGLGAWAGVKEGAHILYQQRWVLAGIFIIDRIIYEILIFLELLILPGDVWQNISNQPYMVIGYWIESLVFSFLGLWLAMTFALLVSKQKEVQPAISPSTVS